MATGENLSFIPKYEYKFISFNHSRKEEIIDMLNELGQEGWYIVDIIRERYILLCRFIGKFSWEDTK